MSANKPFVNATIAFRGITSHHEFSGEYDAILRASDPFNESLSVWSEDFKSLWSGWTVEDLDRAYPQGVSNAS